MCSFIDLLRKYNPAKFGSELGYPVPEMAAYLPYTKISLIKQYRKF